MVLTGCGRKKITSRDTAPPAVVKAVLPQESIEDFYRRQVEEITDDPALNDGDKKAERTLTDTAKIKVTKAVYFLLMHKWEIGTAVATIATSAYYFFWQRNYNNQPLFKDLKAQQDNALKNLKAQQDNDSNALKSWHNRRHHHHSNPNIQPASQSFNMLQQIPSVNIVINQDEEEQEQLAQHRFDRDILALHAQTQQALLVIHNQAQQIQYQNAQTQYQNAQTQLQNAQTQINQNPQQQQNQQIQQNILLAHNQQHQARNDIDQAQQFQIQLNQQDQALLGLLAQQDQALLNLLAQQGNAQRDRDIQTMLFRQAFEIHQMIDFNDIYNLYTRAQMRGNRTYHELQTYNDLMFYMQNNLYAEEFRDLYGALNSEHNNIQFPEQIMQIILTNQNLIDLAFIAGLGETPIFRNYEGRNYKYNIKRRQESFQNILTILAKAHQTYLVRRNT
jgi:hypothetical protein